MITLTFTESEFESMYQALLFARDCRGRDTDEEHYARIKLIEKIDRKVTGNVTD